MDFAIIGLTANSYCLGAKHGNRQAVCCPKVMFPLLALSMVLILFAAKRSCVSKAILVGLYEKAPKALILGLRCHRVVREVLNLYRWENVVGAPDKLQKNANLLIARIFFSALVLESNEFNDFGLYLPSLY